jgi:Uma2 family endonuclease
VGYWRFDQKVSKHVGSYQKHYFNVDEYYKMAEVGLLSEDDRVELIEGEIIEMSPIGSTHGGTVNRSSPFLNRKLGDLAIVSVQNPLRLSDFSEPLPDLALLKPRKDFYSNSHPAPEDVLVVNEVADTSVAYDRNVKLPLYARAGIPEAWLMVLQKEVIEVHSQSKNGKYQKVRRLKRGKTLTSPTVPGLSCRVEDLLG